jgi:HEPN domain-containing protein
MEVAEKQFRIGAGFATMSASTPVGAGNPNLVFGQTSASAVLIAFAVELYLKCILTQMGITKRKHSLLELFYLIPEKDKQGRDPKYIIKEYYYERVELSKKTPLPIGKQFKELRKTINEMHKKMEDFDKMLIKNGNNFELWRYNYETDWAKVKPESYGLFQLCSALQKYILDIKPKWAKHTNYVFLGI